MEKAEPYIYYRCDNSHYDNYDRIKILLVKWAMRAIRLSCTAKNRDVNVPVSNYGTFNNMDKTKQIVKDETNEIFKQVLCDAGVFEFTDEGKKQFDAFIRVSGFVL